MPLSLFFIALIAYGNLRGVRESGKLFAAPTYFFMLNMGVLLAFGMWKYFAGDLPVLGVHQEGMVHFGDEGTGLLLGASAYTLAKAFASGGSAVTGVEAISNGVPAFRQPSWKNARDTLVIMGGGLAVMFLGLSFLASKIKIAPFEDGTPTVLAQIGEAVYGDGGIGETLSSLLNVATMLILVLAANTGFADFPRLASLQASDSFLPRQLTKRGHRLVFSNGIIALGGVAAVLVVITGAAVTELIPLYAISVFTGFTLSQAGMTRHHLRKREPGLRPRHPRQRRGRPHLVRHRGDRHHHPVRRRVADPPAHAAVRHRAAAAQPPVRGRGQAARGGRAGRRQGADPAPPRGARVRRPARRRHRPGHPVRPHPDARRLRAVHFMVDEDAGTALADEWSRLGLARVPLELVACPDRRMVRTAVETVAHELADGDTEVSVLLPDRKYRGLWHRILHDKTAEAFQTGCRGCPTPTSRPCPSTSTSARPKRRWPS